MFSLQRGTNMVIETVLVCDHVGGIYAYLYAEADAERIVTALNAAEGESGEDAPHYMLDYDVKTHGEGLADSLQGDDLAFLVEDEARIGLVIRHNGATKDLLRVMNANPEA